MSTTHINEPTEQKEKQKEIPSLGAISLRDYFAAKALQGILASGNVPDSTTDDEIADCAYEMADLMLKAREQ